MHKTHLISFIFLVATLLASGCGVTGKCADAIDYAETCGVSNLEFEDDVSGCDNHTECRSLCVLAAPCADVKKSFGADRDQTTAAWKCVDKCPSSG